MLTDFHSHILPGIDDGSATIAESIAMLQMEAEQGITQVIATPHFYPQTDSPEHFLKRRKAAEEALREVMSKHDGLPDLTVGAEVYYFRGISDSDFLPGLTIENNCCILIEMPMSHWSESVYRDLWGIYEKQGLTPIIAHIDRYITPFNAHRILSKLEQLPVYIQANAGSFLRPGMRHLMLHLLRTDRIQLLGSDCHNLDDRAPNLAEAVKFIEKHAGPEAIRRIREYENRVLSNRK